MRKLALLSVMAVSVVALSACGKKDNNSNTTEQTTQVESTTQTETTTEETTQTATEETSKDAAESDAQGAVKVLDDIWASYGEDDKFPAAGGDYNEENMREDAAGKYGLEGDEAADAVNNNFGVAKEDLALIDDAASLMHMMNVNSFTAAAFHVTDKENVASVAEHIKDGILAKQWMCGFPDLLVVYQIDDYIVSAYGLTDFIEPFTAKLTEVYPDAVELYKENIE